MHGKTTSTLNTKLVLEIELENVISKLQSYVGLHQCWSNMNRRNEFEVKQKGLARVEKKISRNDWPRLKIKVMLITDDRVHKKSQDVRQPR